MIWGIANGNTKYGVLIEQCGFCTQTSVIWRDIWLILYIVINGSTFHYNYLKHISSPRKLRNSHLHCIWNIALLFGWYWQSTITKKINRDKHSHGQSFRSDPALISQNTWVRRIIYFIYLLLTLLIVHLPEYILVISFIQWHNEYLPFTTKSWILSICFHVP